MRHLFSLLFLLSFLHAETLSLQTLHNEKRVAYVIGNGEYDESPLKQAVSNSVKMKLFLEKFDFEVTHSENVSKRGIIQGLRDFNSNMESDGIALFYFSGHMIQVKGNNYIIPVEALIDSDYHVLYEAIELDAILKKMQETGNRLNIVIIDSGSENPFGNRFRAKVKGIAPFDEHERMDIILSQRPDTTGRPYDFTADLISTLSKKGISNKEGFKFFRSRHTQSFIQSSKQEFYFNIPDTLSDDEEKFWQKISKSDSLSGYTDYLKKYPNGRYAKQANTALDDIQRKDEALFQQQRSLESVNTKERNTTESEDLASNPNDASAYIEPKMLKIKAGSYIMGSDFENPDQSPAHLVNIPKAFYIGQFEVTNAEYNKFLIQTKRTSSLPSNLSADRQPAVGVSWDEATEYARWLSEVSGKTYRLPSEEEWEYAARAGSTKRYFWEEKDPEENNWRTRYPVTADTYAWVKINAQDLSHPVGTKRANAWGLHDVIGNVAEWCKNPYTQNYNTLADTKEIKVIRGGSSLSIAEATTISHRTSKANSFTGNDVGFRLLCEE